ncbi:hypothetical protein N9B04_01345 [bacterium]|jgi:hypothetical protein|nr:hypothetical protein [bacterium]
MIKVLIVTSITLSGLVMSTHTHRCGEHALAESETHICCGLPHEHPSNQSHSGERIGAVDVLDHECVLCRLLAQFQVDVPTVDRLLVGDVSVSESVSVIPVFLKEVHFRQSGRAPPISRSFCS